MAISNKGLKSRNVRYIGYDCVNQVVINSVRTDNSKNRIRCSTIATTTTTTTATSKIKTSNYKNDRNNINNSITLSFT